MKNLLDNNGVKRLVQNIKNWVTPLINDAAGRYFNAPNSIVVKMQDGKIVVNLIENGKEKPLELWNLNQLIYYNKPISIVININAPIIMSNNYRISHLYSENCIGVVGLSIFMNNNNNTIYYNPITKTCVIKKDDFHDIIPEFFFNIYVNNRANLANEKIRLHDVFQIDYDDGRVYSYKSLPIIELRFDELGNIINPSKIYFNDNKGEYYPDEATANIFIIDSDIYHTDNVNDRNLKVRDVNGNEIGTLTQYLQIELNSKGEYVQRCSYESLNETEVFYNVYRKIDDNYLCLYEDMECTKQLITNSHLKNITYNASYMMYLNITNIRDNNNNYMTGFIIGYRNNGKFILRGVNNYFDCQYIGNTTEHTTINASYCKVTHSIREIVEDDFTSI